LYSGNGTLLSRQGTRLKRDCEILLARPLFRARLDSERDEGRALNALQSLFLRYGQLTQGWSRTHDAVSQLKLLADELADLCLAHSDLCLCMAAYLPGKSRATRHSFAVAIVALLLGNALAWNSKQRQTLARAALTMNLSLLSDHDDWAVTRGPLSAIQRSQQRCHPRLSADLLSRSSGADARWVTAVDQHHENLDGSGYPRGIKGVEIGAEARLLRVADTWCALVFHCSGRGRKPAQLALNDLSQSARGHLDHHVFLALKKLMGPYPPGSLIRLANRETALIVRWSPLGSLPLTALSIISAAGEIMPEFKLRTVNQRGFRILDYAQLNLAQMSRLPWHRVWAAG
jgi:HD-GYP domain-containing protein (c-di-GMP phosphodiesterase class II)